MHPIERLRYVARSHGGDQRTLVAETATALRGLGLDHAGLVVACRRILQRHPSAGALWWLCASALHAVEPLAVARRLAAEVDDDPTPEVLIDLLAADATVGLAGWPDLAGEAVLRRGDLRVVVLDVADGDAFARRLARSDVDVELVPAQAAVAAVGRCDVVLVEALAAGCSEMLAVTGSAVLTAAAAHTGIPVWGVAGRGRCLPEPLFAELVTRCVDGDRPWESPDERVLVSWCTELVRPDGRSPVDGAPLSPECPHAPELLRTGAI